MSPHLNLQSKFKIIFFLGLILILYNEFLVYWISYMNWPEVYEPPGYNNNNDPELKPVRILLVADPQLIGENDEPWYYSWLARWDSDRYLHATYTLANSFVQPNATIYLGDLFDEGLKSSDEQYERYFQRFKKIFQFEKMASLGIRQIFISGDNDVGGEYLGDRNDYLAERFESYFGDMVDVVELNRFLNFVKLDLDYTVSFYDRVKRGYLKKLLAKLERKEEERNSSKINNEKFTIILNHMSLLMKQYEELDALNKDTNAGLIIKGDSHKFYLAKYNYLSEKVDELIDFNRNPSNFYIMHLQADKKDRHVPVVYELSIPTCSYRMGVPDMGYGVLTITPKGKAYVSILWLPSRFKCIKIYLIFLFCLSLYITLSFLMKKCLFRFLRNFYRIFIYKFVVLF